MKKHSGLFTKENQPSAEARAEARKTRSVKLKVSVLMSALVVKNIFKPAQIAKMYPHYDTLFPTIEAFAEATAAEIMACNIFRHVMDYDKATNAQNTLKVLKHLDVMSYDDIKQTLNPVFHFDKYESDF
jgi:hypothetical protein